jgi:hypothetical protein
VLVVSFEIGLTILLRKTSFFSTIWLRLRRYGYKQLQTICKTARRNDGNVEGRKKVMLLSATPLNNRPEDLKNLILLFQNAALSTVEGIGDLNRFFKPFIDKNRQQQKERRQELPPSELVAKHSGISDEKEQYYEELRSQLLNKITIRRTRSNILNDPAYKKDLDSSNIKFPKIAKPKTFKYKMESELNALFNDTLTLLTERLQYARYRLVNYLKADVREQHFGEAAQNVGENLASIFKIRMVKRLESSFYAFRKSLDNLLKITTETLTMFKKGTVLIADQQIMRRINAGQSIDDIIVLLEEKRDGKRYTFSPADFADNGQELIEMLEADKALLQKLKEDWQKWKQDPKLKLFIRKLKSTLFSPTTNLTGKLVIFSESVDTVRYLERQLKKRLNRQDIIAVTAKNRNSCKQVLRKCFDANIPAEEQSNDFNILIASDALSEGINLHRANVIVNYDAPWNATRIMQRNGRVNRIGSTAGEIHNYLFYPSDEGDAQIKLYDNILIKLQAFHSLLGEDSQIFSIEEVVREFNLFTAHIKDEVDKILLLQREIRKLYQTDKGLYRRIQKLPMRCRTFRRSSAKGSAGTTLAFIKSQAKLEYYRITGEKNEALDFITTAEILKAKPEEKPASFDDEMDTQHYIAVQRALAEFQKESVSLQDTDSLHHRLQAIDRKTSQAIAFLRDYKRMSEDEHLWDICSGL